MLGTAESAASLQKSKHSIATHAQTEEQMRLSSQIQQG